MTQSTNSKLSVLDAAYKVLCDAGESLHGNVLTQRMIEAGLYTAKGSTPAQTVISAISMDMKTFGVASRFCRVAPNTFALNTGHASQPLQHVPVTPTFSQSAEPAKQDSDKTLSFADAAERVLQQSAGQKPLHYQEITQRALNQGLIQTAGQTPAATMYAIILTEIGKFTKRGEQSRFTKLGKGMVGLAAWTRRHHGLADQIEHHNRETRGQLHASLHTMKPADFEALVGRLLTALGFESVEVTSISNDGGIDVRGILVVGDVIRTRMAVQVKRWKKNVQSPTVQQVRGSLGAHEQGLIITTSKFSPGAREEAVRPNAIPVALMDGDQLVNLLIENDIGVQRTSYDLIELGESEEQNE